MRHLVITNPANFDGGRFAEVTETTSDGSFVVVRFLDDPREMHADTDHNKGEMASFHMSDTAAPEDVPEDWLMFDGDLSSEVIFWAEDPDDEGNLVNQF